MQFLMMNLILHIWTPISSKPLTVIWIRHSHRSQQIIRHIGIIRVQEGLAKITQITLSNRIIGCKSWEKQTSMQETGEKTVALSCITTIFFLLWCAIFSSFLFLFFSYGICYLFYVISSLILSIFVFIHLSIRIVPSKTYALLQI